MKIRINLHPSVVAAVFAAAVAVVVPALSASGDETIPDLEWKELVGTNRAPESVASSVCVTAVAAVTGSEEDSAEFFLNTYPPGFCVILR